MEIFSNTSIRSGAYPYGLLTDPSIFLGLCWRSLLQQTSWCTRTFSHQVSGFCSDC